MQNENGWIKYYYIKNPSDRPMPEKDRFIEYKNSFDARIDVADTNEFMICLNYASPIVITEYRYITENEFRERKGGAITAPPHFIMCG